jgi:Rieske Fe-S protein
MLSQTTPGSPQRFEARGVTGFLHVDPTTHAVSAVSGVCTDQPCILEPSHTGDHLVCPCHGAQFATDGTPMPSEYSYRWGPFPALAHIKTRVVGDEIQVFSA